MPILSNDKLRLLFFLFHGNLIATVFYDLVLRNTCRFFQADHFLMTFLIGIIFGVVIIAISIYSIIILYITGFNSHDVHQFSFPNHMKVAFGLLILIFMLKLCYVIHKVFGSTLRTEDSLVYGFQLLFLSIGILITFKISQIVTKKTFIFCGNK
jgi:hypothetical protein